MSSFTLHEDRAALSSRVLPLIHEGISEMWQEDVTTSQYMLPMVNPGDRVVYGVSPDGDAVGVVCFNLTGPEALVGLLYVEPSSRRLGLGTLLWQKMLEVSGRERALTVRMMVHVNNEAGLAFAEQLGVQETVSVFEQVVPRKV